MNTTIKEPTREELVDNIAKCRFGSMNEKQFKATVDYVLARHAHTIRTETLREAREVAPPEKSINHPVDYSTGAARKITAIRDNHAGFNTCRSIFLKNLTTLEQKSLPTSK